MKGFDLRCDAPPGESCGTAIVLTGGGPGISVTSTPPLDPSDPPAWVVGSWIRGIDRQSFPSTRVTGIMPRGYFGVAAISNCSFVDNNSIAAIPSTDSDPFTDGFPIVTTLGITYTGAAVMTGNYIDGCNTAIRRGITGIANNSQVTFNVINHRNVRPGSPPSAAPFAGVAIDLQSSTERSAVVRDNLIVGDSDGPVVRVNTLSPHLISFSSNICKHGLANCSSCVASGFCAASATVTSP